MHQHRQLSGQQQQAQQQAEARHGTNDTNQIE
jgi:hypothetical protein